MKLSDRLCLLTCAALLVLAAFIISERRLQAAPPGPGSPTDPCLYQPMNQVPIAVATSAGPGTAALITHVAGTEIHICQIPATVPTSSSFQFYQGPTGGVGLIPMTGALTSVPAMPQMTLLRANMNNDVYLKTTGTGMQGWVDYVYEVPPFQYAGTTAIATTTATPTATFTPTPTAMPT